MNPRQLKFWGDAFALMAFITPPIYIVAGICFVKTAKLPAWSIVDTVLMFVLMALLPVCFFGGLIFTIVGLIKKRRRVTWQGIFGLSVGAALYFISLLIIVAMHD